MPEITSVDEFAMADYVRAANTKFSTAMGELNAMKALAKGAMYEGENSAKFKNGLVTTVATFAMQTTNNMQNITGAVNSATSAIGSSLGAAIATVGFSTDVTVANDADASVSQTKAIDYESMNAVRDGLVRHIETVQAIVREHQGSLEATPWTGVAKTQAVGEVGDLTTTITRQCEAMSAEITTAINTQIQSTQAADRLGV